MALLDGLLGGGNNDSSQASSDSNAFDSVFGTNPNFGLNASDILHSSDSSTDRGGGSDSSSFTGIGDLGLNFAAPSFLGVSSSNDHQNASETDSHGGGGGLLGGLL